MKFIFDTDGTLTDFNKFVRDNAINYFEERYGMTVVYPDELEIEDIFDMDNFFSKKYNCDLDRAKEFTKKVLDKFWVNFPRFIKFSLIGKFRYGASDFINYCKKSGYKIEIHTSRGKTTENNIVGEVARKFTYLQYLINGVKLPYEAFHFYKNDQEKIEGIKESKPDLVFEDKEDILYELNNNNIRTICINGTHNKTIVENNFLKKIDDYDIEKLESIIKDIMGEKKYSVKKRISESDLVYKKVRIVRPIINNKFKPIILNKENLIVDDDCSILIAPNHRSTLDPLIITSIIDKNIHWAALKRFFDGQDSIFNNSKNPFLCKITAKSFKKMEYFPIERKRDNPQASNFKSIKDMHEFLKNKQYVGIFPEGTTNKSKDVDFGVFDTSFINLAKKSDAWIQPITMLWIKDLDIKHKAIVNFGKPFKVSELTIEEAYNKYLNIQIECLKENKELAEKLKNDNIKKLIKKV